ncbi:uncharacterized protein LOC131957470 [Physella acuta]|uniref:uncharacterized protein LOC131957470 n=1 Tax=Physella acuta TaxID=109671 RepID=UPI0027DBA892|nr:uncharacterized protein LOC131957470 [Physella acuta]
MLVIATAIHLVTTRSLPNDDDVEMLDITELQECAKQSISIDDASSTSTTASLKKTHPDVLARMREKIPDLTHDEVNEILALKDKMAKNNHFPCLAEIDEMATMLQSNRHYIEEETMLDFTQGVRFAPGEGEIPIPLLMDPYCEELIFARTWGGYMREPIHQTGKKLSYAEIAKSQIRRSDRRCARAEVLFFIYQKTKIAQLQGQMSYAFRRTGQDRGVTVSQALNKEFLLTQQLDDNIYRFASTVTGTPAYWEAQKKSVLAQVRQNGIFTFFITLSAAETHWPELIVSLMRTVHKKDITEEEAMALSFNQKAELIRKDPVTCALHFDHRFRELRKTWNTEGGPFEDYKMENLYYRIEFQHRGSPHVHMLVWLKNAPAFDAESNDSKEECIKFIDKMITTDTVAADVKDIIGFQFHKCTSTCDRMRDGQKVCRFNYPIPPMDQTRILSPIHKELLKEMPKEKQKKLREIKAKLRAVLDLETKENTVGDFNDLLAVLECTNKEYTDAISTTLTQEKVFLKRLPKDCRINGYNKKILSLMRSNMDIQFVTNPYQCVSYVVDYINKSQRGLSRLLRELVADFKRGNFTHKEKLKKISNVLYNCTEISAQEVAWIRLQLKMASSSVVVDFIPTGPRKDRHKILKPDAELKRIRDKDPDNQDIYLKGPVDRYSLRPDELEDKCLAEFIAEYTYQGKGNKKDAEDDELADDVEVEEMINDEDEGAAKKLKVFQLKDNSGSIKERKRPKVIRYCRFSRDKDPANYFREMVMLYSPWRDEVKEIEEGNCEAIFLEKKIVIDVNYKNYNKIGEDLNQIYIDIQAERDQEENANAEETILDENGQTIKPDVNYYDYDDTVIVPDLLNELGQDVAVGEEVKRYKVPGMLSNNDYNKLIDSLNTRQHNYHQHLLSCLKNGKLPFYHFISGGAGVGKSKLIEAIYQTVTRHYRGEAGSAESIEVLLTAFTGKAAHNIGGMTVTSALSLSVTAGASKAKELSSDALNTLYSKFRNLKLLIIDEISMLSLANFNQVDSRLRQLLNKDLPFGGIPVIVVGDFNQIPPVLAQYVFEEPKKDLASLAGNTLWPLFELYELTEIMRQKDDWKFAKALGGIANGSLTEEEAAMFKSREFTSSTLPERGQNAIHIFFRNEDVDDFNKKRNIMAREKLSKLPPKPSGSAPLQLDFPAIDKYPTGKDPKETAAIKAKAEFHITGKDKGKRVKKPKPVKDMAALPTTNYFTVGVKYMVTSNIDTQDGLFNGATGVLRHLEIKDHHLKTIWFEFANPEVGATARSKRGRVHLPTDNPSVTRPIPSTWTPINLLKGTFNVLKGLTVTREQFPVVLAEAITIHKSQGASMESVVVSMKDLTRQLQYVGLSRATSLQGLFILGTFTIKPSTPGTKKCQDMMAKLRVEKPLKLVFDEQAFM